jgi:hypothetical protein
MRKILDNEEIVLADEHKKKITARWNDLSQSPPSLVELIKICFGVDEDGFGKHGLAVRKFLAESKIRSKTKTPLERRINVPSELTEDQKLYISNNISTLKPLEIAKFLFDNEKISAASMEFKLVSDFIKTIPSHLKEVGGKDENSDGLGKYRPPKTPLAAARRVNSFIYNCINTSDIEKNSKLLNCLNQFIRFCHMPRFVLNFDAYKAQEDKDLFESTYVRYVWDKPDLTEEELDIYVNLCADIVNLTNLEKEKDYLISLRDSCAEDTEGKRVSMSIVQALADLRSEIDDAYKRIKTTAESLQGKRNERIDVKTKENASLVNLIDFWRNYENRQQILRLAEARKKNLKTEIERIETMSDLVMEVYGIGKDEAILGSI